MQAQSRSEELDKKRSFWRQHIEDWRSSGLTQIAYCRQHELRSHQFTYWKKRFVQTGTGITFVPLKIRSTVQTAFGQGSLSMLRLTVGRDFQIEIGPDFDSHLLRRLITTLRTVP
jgi:hypothetical protein